MKRTEAKNTILIRLIDSGLVGSTLLALPNKPFNPPMPDQENPILWARASFGSGDASQQSIGGVGVSTRFDRADIMTVQVFAPVGVGTTLLGDLAEDIADLYEHQPLDRPIRYGQPLPVRVTEAVPDDGAWIMQNVLVPYTFDVIK